MTTFRVWAPDAQDVVVDLQGREEPMEATEGGWWSVEVDDAGPGSEYGFRLDGSDPLPDPRSPSQPDGPHGRSRLVDHGAFPWTDDAWRGLHLPSAVLYELHVGTFTHEGTFDAAITKLDHLVDLGITAVELLPVAEFAGARGWGYDGVDLFAPHSAYGGPDGLKRLVDACHHRGLGVILDVVYNHLGPEGNYLGSFGPYFTDFYATPWGQAVNYDQARSDEVRRFVIDNALMWLGQYHIDGLRLDAVHAIIDTSAVHVLEQLATEVDGLATCVGRPLWLIAESDLNDPRLLLPRQAGGFGLDAQWSDDFHHTIHTTLTGEVDGYYEDYEHLDQLVTVVEEGWLFSGRWSDHRQRTHGRPLGGLPGWRLLGYLQNHDQVGNRAVGDRIGRTVTTGRAKVGAALYLLGPFLPMVFQGEEWDASTPFQYFTSHTDPELGRAVAAGRRSEFAAFGWDPDDVPNPQDPATFERSKLDWDELSEGDHAGVLAWYTACIALRRATPDLGNGRLDLVRARCDAAAGTVVVERGPITIVANLGDGTARVDLDRARATHVLLASEDAATVEATTVVAPPDSVVVLGPA